ncbi:ABC transporter ATP-binding protein [Paraburkholderia tropica]|uniref:Amino acid/amide ABC transporter ATP-binding protein 1, HAAT family n=2 Tax=Paraburkholderia TaxID=1822464 RepID=A0AAQ1GNR0_9BURK|nr:ABC transporter ATP-binding protein [Paraburkholderia tropica]QNB11019.1 ABC transporter ATP-binding protein [Paraburkholderia tropica]RQN34774.1 ABC transporter ATP-binding protein [Paraburkholderia tropica]SEK14677.1 amino acid/amide ABC transporter ATP-binding protein 1, HAAT family [Paraburkholderia tropica]
MTIALRLSGIEKRFGATPVLRGVDLDVRAGERHALIGPNGAGKSTLFSLIAGEQRASAGRIELYGRDVTRLGPPALARRGLARSFQTTSVFARLSVRENLRCAVLASLRGGAGFAARWFGSAQADARAADVLDAIGLAHAAEREAATLSYAEQRALDLGLALAGGGQTLLLDEPTAGMNRAEAARALALIRATTAGKTLLLVEHDMDAVFGLADRVSVLVQGRVIATGTPQAIRADAAVREAYLGADFGAASS